VLYRSDSLAELSDQDVAYLARLRLHRVVDFRSAAERERDPDRLPDGVAAVWQPIAGAGLDPVALRDRAVMYQRLGWFAAAIADLEAALERASDAGMTGALARLRDALRARLGRPH